MALTLAQIENRAAAERLVLLGGFHPDNDPDLPAGTETLVLLGPDGAGFWPHASAAAEFGDGRPDPLDRWSARVIGAMAAALGATALFPFGRKPPAPFVSWALASGDAWISPVGLLVHARAGLWVSFRGALALPDRIALPAPAANPCDSCAGKPCLGACPVAALTGRGYDLDTCHGYLDTRAGNSCLSAGCAVRAACPVSRAFDRDPDQSAFHMKAFHP